MKKYHRFIFFTKIPLEGYYRYRDTFQIFPANLENMPTASLQSHFPNILEYWTTDDEKILLSYEDDEINTLFAEGATTILKQDKILSLLSVFTNHLFFRYTDIYGAWGVPILADNPSEKINTWYSKWCLPLYVFPELSEQLKISKFTDLTLKGINQVEEYSYYTYYPNLDFYKDKAITFPSSIDRLFDSYYALDSTKSSLIDSAISYTISAVELYDSKKTLSFLASFSAIETMVNVEYKDIDNERCPTCGQLRYSVAKKFRDYLLKYIGNTENNKKKFNLYYSLRSKMVHTGQQLQTDKSFANVPKKEHGEEILHRTEVLQISRLAIINWLLTKKST